MKNFKATIIIVLLLVLPSTKAFSQIDVSTNPLAALFGSYGLSGEKVLNEYMGLALSVNYEDREALDNDYNGFSSDVMFKYYFKPEANLGADRWYAGAFLEYSSLATDFGTEIDVKSVNLGMVVGFKTISEKGVFFEAAVGAGRRLTATYKVDGVEDEDFNDFNDLVPSFYGKLALGYRIK